MNCNYVPLVYLTIAKTIPHLTKRAADSPKAGAKSAKRKVVKTKVIRPAKSG